MKRWLLMVFLVACATRSDGQPSPESDARVRELQDKLDSLQRQLDEVGSAKDPATRERLMQQNWQGAQDYMGWMHDRWGMGYPWMMGRYPSGCPMMGGSMMGGSMMGGSMMGGPMMGGQGQGWPLPQGMDPDQYRQKMRETMQRRKEEMDRIARSTDPQERTRMLQEHWQNMYRDMQTMRGMGWMWEGYMMGPGMMGGRPLPTAKPLPQPTSEGARLAATYCVQCHAAPQPSLHTAAEWSSVLPRMGEHMNRGMPNIKIPTESEMRAIIDYMQNNAR